MMLMVTPAATPDGQRRKRRSILPHWRDWYAVAGLWLGVPLLGIVIALLIPLYNWIRIGGDGDGELDAMTSAALQPAPIDGQRAYGYLKQLCEFGPRPAGSEANTRQREFVAKHFEKMGGKVRTQPFKGNDPETGQVVQMVNLIGSWHPELTDRILIASHYDTRPHPDQEVDPARYRLPFLGANDGGSGVALIMEIAHHLNDLHLAVGVDLVLLDGEELVYGQNGEYFLGSKAFAQAYRSDRRAGRIKYRYRAGLLFDMVGGTNLSLKREPYSVKLAPRLVQEVWTIADRLGVRAFTRDYGREVLDDHLALNDGGIPTIDLIDFDYPHWHMASDLPENCSAASLKEVGRVVTAWLAAQPRRKL